MTDDELGSESEGANEVGRLDPAEAMRLIEREQASVGRRLDPNPMLFFAPWGLVWLIGYGLFFLRYGIDDRPLVSMPTWLPGTVLTVLIVAAIVISTATGIGVGRQVAGESNRRGMAYGLSFFLAFAVTGVTLGRITDHLPPAEAGLMWAAVTTGLIGALYVAGAAVWLDWTMFVLGVWITAVDIIGVIAGPGWHSLIVAVAGGGGLLACGVVSHHRWQVRWAT